MEQKTKDKVAQVSRLLQLPREIRDLIYEYALIRDTVPIDCAVVEGPGYRKHTGFPCPYSPQLHKAYPLKSPRVHRSTWLLPIYDLKVDIQGGTWMEPKRAQMTYQLAPPCTRPKDTYYPDKIALQLLLVCRKVYSEARTLFYKKNIFSFTGKFPISTALRFLQDRPATALAVLSSIELVLTEDNNMRGTTDAHFPPTRRSSDCLVLQHAFHYFTDLCTLLSSSAVQLRRLYLTIESVSSYGDSQPTTLAECLTWEAEKSSAEQPCVASWIQPLLQIESLESVKIYWISDRPRLRRMSNTLSTMQQSMLRCICGEGNGQKHIPQGHEVEFSIVTDYDNNATTMIVSDPQAEYFEWGDCSCEGRLIGLEHIHEDDPKHTRAYYKCGVAMWKEHETCFTGFKSAYKSYCELNSKCSPQIARRRSSTCEVHLGR
ncbi:Tryprostatin B 6-hydroxylase [Ascochyta lentis]